MGKEPPDSGRRKEQAFLKSNGQCRGEKGLPEAASSTGRAIPEAQAAEGKRLSRKQQAAQAERRACERAAYHGGADRNPYGAGHPCRDDPGGFLPVRTRPCDPDRDYGCHWECSKAQMPCAAG